MKTIIIKTQSDYDQLPSEFKDFTCIEIRSTETIHIRRTPKNSTVHARNSSTVYAHDSSTVYAYNSSTVNAYNSSTVRAYNSSTVNTYHSSTVYAHDSSTVHAYNLSTVYAHDSSTVYAYLSSTVYAHHSSTVRAYGSSTVHAYGSSTVHAYGSSTVYAIDSSTIHAYITSTTHLHSNISKVKAYDNSHIFIKCDDPNIEVKSNAVTTTKQENLITPTFEDWLERGVLCADGIYQNIKSKKTIGDLTLYETDQGFAAQKGNKFAHGKTIEEAKNDLRYKLSDRDTSKYDSWTTETIATVDEMIECYMTITGACSFGTKQFCESAELKESYSVAEVIKLTDGKYGNEEFETFFSNK